MFAVPLPLFDWERFCHSGKHRATMGGKHRAITPGNHRAAMPGKHRATTPGKVYPGQCAVCEEFIKKQAEWDREDAALMICLVTNKAPVDEEFIKQIQQQMSEDMPIDHPISLEGMSWERWLNELKTLPEDAPEWSKLEDFIAAIRQISQSKIEEQGQKIKLLQQVIQELKSSAEELLIYFELQGVKFWEAEHCPKDDIAITTEKVGDLRNKLVEHHTLSAKASTNLIEEKQKRSSLSELETKITGLYNKLNPILSSVEEETANEAIVDVSITKSTGEEQVIFEITSPPIDDHREIVQEPISPETTEILSTSVETPANTIDKKFEVLSIETKSDILGNVESEADIVVEKDLNKPLIDIHIEERIGEVIVGPIPEPALEKVVENKEQIESQAEGKVKEEEAIDFTSGAVAAQLIANDSTETWQKFFWTLIAEDDLAGAYWLLLSLENREIDKPINPWLIEAIQGSRWVSAESAAFVPDILEISRSYQPQGGKIEEILSLSAALRPALITPYSGMIGWLNTPTELPAINDLVNAVHTFASHGIALNPTDIFGVSGLEQRKGLLREIITSSKRWLEESIVKKIMFKRASDVWRFLAGPSGELRSMMGIVSRDNRKELQALNDQVNQWRSRDYSLHRIEEIDHDLYKQRTNEIVGSPRDQLLRRIVEVCEIAEQWSTYVSHEQELESRGNWIFQQVDQLRSQVQTSLPKAFAALDELITIDQSVQIRGASICLKRSIIQLIKTLQLKVQNDLLGSLKQTCWDWLPIGTDIIQDGISRRLLALPEVELSDNGKPTQNSPAQIGPALRDAGTKDNQLLAAIDGWIAKQDYRFVEVLMNAVSEQVEIPDLSHRFQEAIALSRNVLIQNKQSTIDSIEQAVVDGFIGDERSEYAAVLESINTDHVLNFPSKFKALEEIRNSISEIKNSRLVDLKHRWQEYKKRLENSQFTPTQRRQVDRRISKAFSDKDTRLVEEYLARLSDLLDSGGDLDESWLPGEDHQDILEDFKASTEVIEKWIESSKNNFKYLENDIENGRTIAGMKFGEVSTTRREEAVNAIEAWRELKSSKGRNPRNSQLIETVVKYLGFSLIGHSADVVSIDEADSDWMHANVKMSAGDLSKPIPQFGSLARNRYDIICLWERPGAEMISSRIQGLHLRMNTVLVIYLGRLTNKQRQDLFRISREQELAIALLDEVLLLYLTQERDARLPAFLKCALPYTAINPYTPFQAGDVPAEMFFGREGMARDIQELKGTSLVFGGRQLGKSALLRHVEREFHNPTRSKFARVEDIKLVGDPTAGQPPEMLWRRLREILKDFGLLSEKITTNKPEEIERYIRQVMEERTDLEVLILFDEADNFLDADANESFRVTERLRVMMNSTQRRFTVIFAGLHNVQRFQGIANQPFAHFGTPLCVGPLEPDAAYQLIQQPLDYLGFRFADDAGILRILSYTNYHPGLIQLFCQELLNLLRARTWISHPPYKIAQNDIEAVYRSIRDRIRERFDWTLALDTRYQAIAWSLIQDQMEMKDSYAKPYSPGAILGLVRYWWPQGFVEVETEELRGLLDEMVGLGVLQRDLNGHFRLRSPNLVRLMGTETDVETKLVELSDKQPVGAFEADQLHAPIDEKAKRYSPFTYAQERLLNVHRFGVGLIFGSQALGLDSIPDALQKYVPDDGQSMSGTFAEIPLYVSNKDDLKTWIERYEQKYPDMDFRVLLYKPVHTNPDELLRLVEGGVDFCNRHFSKKKALRLYYLFDPEATWEWLKIGLPTRELINTITDAVLSPRKWTVAGIKQRLSQNDKLYSEIVCDDVYQATGGWPILVDMLFDKCGRIDDPRPFAKQIESGLSQSNSEISIKFKTSLGLDSITGIKGLIEYMIQLQSDQIPVDLITPENIQDIPGCTQEFCDQAIEYLKRMGIIDRTSDVVYVDQLVQRVFKQ